MPGPESVAFTTLLKFKGYLPTSGPEDMPAGVKGEATGSTSYRRQGLGSVLTPPEEQCEFVNGARGLPGDLPGYAATATRRPQSGRSPLTGGGTGTNRGGP